MFRKSQITNEIRRRFCRPFVVLSSADMSTEATGRMHRARCAEPEPGADILIKDTGRSTWGTDQPFGKFNLVPSLIGYRTTMGQRCGTDKICMNKFLSVILLSSLQFVQNHSQDEFLPAEAALIDYLYVAQDRRDAWRYPPREEILLYRKNRVLSQLMLEDMEVKEIIAGVTSKEEMAEIFEWFWEQFNKDQLIFPTHTVSMDVKEVSETLYDCYRLAGKMDREDGRRLESRPNPSRIGDYPEDRMQQLSALIMIVNGISFDSMISLNLQRDEDYQYIMSLLQVQPKLVEFLESLPVCTGLGVKSDVEEVEFFYSLRHRKEITMAGYIDLTSLALVAEYELRAKGMTAMAVQVLGMLMNKCCSTGDDKWGWFWRDIPAGLKIYGLENNSAIYATWF